MLSIVFGLLSLKSLNNEIVLLPLLIIISFEVILIKNKKVIEANKTDKKKFIISTFLCFLFLIILPIDVCLSNLHIFGNILIVDFIIRTLFLISLTMSIFYILIFLFSYDCKQVENVEKTKKLIMIITVIICLIFISSTSTGFFDWDFSGIWQLPDVAWSNWHTFAFGFLVYISRVLLHSPYLAVILNFILYIKFFSYALDLLAKNVKNKNIIIIFFLINIFTIVGFDQLRYVKKDIIFALGFCNLILTTFDYLLSNKFTIKHFLNFTIFSSIIVLFRHGGIYLLIFVFSLIFIYIVSKHKYYEIKYCLGTVVYAIGLYSIVNYIGFNIIGGYNYPDTVTYTVPIYQVGSFANNGYEFSNKDREYVEQYLPIDYMANHFEKYNADTLTRSWNIPDDLQVDDNFDYKGFIKVNYNLFINKPMFYVQSLLDLTNILWKIEPNNDELFFYFVKWDKSADIVMYKETYINKFIDPMVDILLKGFLYNLRIRGSFPLFMLIVSSLILIYKKKYKYLIPISFLFFWYICLFLSLPFSLTRYCLPFINIYPFIICFCLGIRKSEL